LLNIEFNLELRQVNKKGLYLYLFFFLQVFSVFSTNELKLNSWW